MPVDHRPDSDGAILPLDRLDAVVFDTDGVLTDTASVHSAAWKRLFDEYLQERAERLGEPFRPFENDDYLRYVAGSPSDPPEAETVGGLGNRKNGYFLALVAEDGVRPFASSVALVRALRSRGVRLAAVSASRNFATVLRAAEMHGLFDAEVDGVDAARLGLAGKPDPALFLEAAGRLGVRPERAAVVEDALAGVEAGRRGGFGLVVGVDRGDLAEELKARGADVVVADLGELRIDDRPAGS